MTQGNTFKSQLPLDSSKELFAPKQLNQGLIFHFPGARCQACIQCQHYLIFLTFLMRRLTFTSQTFLFLSSSERKYELFVFFLHCFGKQRFSLSQNAAAEASNRQLHISTSKGPNGCCFNETLKRLVTIPQDLWIITLIPAWDHDNFVWRIWNHCERCDSIEKLAISTFAHRSCLLLIGAKIFLSFRLNN